MKKLVVTALVMTAVCALGGCSKKETAAKSGKVFDLNISHIVVESNSWHKGGLFIKDELEKRSNGQIKVNIYPNSQLGTELDGIKQIMSEEDGTDIIFTGESMSSVIPEAAVIGIPYLVSNYQQLDTLINGPVGKRLEALFLEKANMRVLGYFTRGPRDITSNKPIRTPADLNGFVIRVPASPIHVAAWEALGAKPVPMAFAEVFTALQQHTIDGQENPLAMIQSGSFYEVQSHLNKSEHLISWVYIVISESKFQSMPKDLQDLVIQVAKEAQAYENKLFLEDEASLEQFMKDRGMTVVSDVDKAAFAAKALPGVENVLSTNPSYKDSAWPLYQEAKASLK